MIHMLKWDIQPERRSPSWIASIAEHRARMADELSDSPSYAARIGEAAQRAFRIARPAAARQTRLPLGRFPERCPYDCEAIVAREHELDP